MNYLYNHLYTLTSTEIRLLQKIVDLNEWRNNSTNRNIKKITSLHKNAIYS